MKKIIVIPVRMKSKRLAKKPLLQVNDKTIIQMVYENAKTTSADEIIIASEDSEIIQEANKIKAKSFKSSPNHKNGTLRVQEVISTEYPDADFIINLQGDEPLLSSKYLDLIFNTLEEGIYDCVTLITKVNNVEDIMNPDSVKVVTDLSNNILYFSRAVIPYNYSSKHEFYKHIGVYGFSKRLLKLYSKLPYKLEELEGLEQLRILENGIKIHAVEIKENVISINSLDDYENLKRICNE